MKEEYNHYQLLKHLPSDFRQFLEHIQALDYYDKPDYAMLSGLFERCMKRRGVKVRVHRRHRRRAFRVGSVPAVAPKQL